ncbi:MAG: hypothetical protein NUW23_09245 [Firmicutes bacterium]|jgi:hypothetical protein|nr:hypothetical protein [Bacillota bacterium]
MRRRFLVILSLLALTIAVVLGNPVRAGAKEGYEVITSEPAIHAGMFVTFKRIVAHTLTDYEWEVTVQNSRYPDWVEISWVWPRSDGTRPPAKTRSLTSMARGRTFGPIFTQGDRYETDATAPWVSREVLRELRTDRVAYNFRLGTVSLMGIVAVDLRVEEEVLYPIELNGRRVHLPAFKCYNGQLTIWNNLQNPLVLEFRPVGIPVLSSVVGWKAESMSIRGRV